VRGQKESMVDATTAPEKREVTGSTPVPTTGKNQARTYRDWWSLSCSKLRAHNVPARNWNTFQFR
jgi:hypothetical protein